MSSFVGAIAIADLVKTTLGPNGMDKILQSVSLRSLSPCCFAIPSLRLFFPLPFVLSCSKLLGENVKRT